jgi:hypothetical protein
MYVPRDLCVFYLFRTLGQRIISIQLILIVVFFGVNARAGELLLEAQNFFGDADFCC